MNTDRRHITEKALELFRKISFSKTSVADIAAACGLGKGTIYLYFRSKDAILFSIIEEYLARVMEPARSFFEDPGVPMHAKLQRFFESLVDGYFTIKDLTFGSFESVRGSTLQEIFQKCTRYHHQSIDNLVEIVGRQHPWSEVDPLALRTRLAELTDLMVGRMFLFLIRNDWSDKPGLQAIIAPLAPKLFDAIVGDSTHVQEDFA